MATESLTCPFCSAQFQLTTPAVGRVVCPRCGEAQPAVGSSDGQLAAPVVTPAQPRSNRKVVATLGLIMLTMAAIGLAFALWTISDRRKRDPKELTKVEVTAPAELALLGYVPADCEAVLGVHVAELLETTQGRDFLQQFRLPVANIGLDNLERSFGVRVEEIDHLVLALRVSEGGLPRTTIMFQTRKPADPKRVAEAMKSVGTRKSAKGRTYRTTRLPGVPLEAALWFADDDYRMFIHALDATMDKVPETPQPSSDHLAPPVRKFLRERSKGTQFWFFGDIEDWNQTYLPGLAGPPIGLLAQETVDTIKLVRGAAAWLELREDLQVHALLEAREVTGATTLTTLTKGGLLAFRLAGNRPPLNPLNQELLKHVRVEQKEKVLSLQTTLSAKALREVLTRAEPEPEPEKKK